ncbi:hypothetical protein BCR34DRAFT_593516 [Clohesyomyces aquaticus]|uniref:Uncharacterized protein n=1 Tax=Clohesyomyces aquaticus TaxID=1231657 RepID=A0A1Y1YHH4_9PLEO|nr:hypothetical protein BCR34DRAFT_593516 [Clohesyomyces aquaticus]
MSRPPTPSELQDMLQHLDDDRRTAMIVSSAVCGILATVFVALRVAARKVLGVPFRADDWWMFVSVNTDIVGLDYELLFTAEILYFATVFTITIKDSLIYQYG